MNKQTIYIDEIINNNLDENIENNFIIKENYKVLIKTIKKPTCAIKNYQDGRLINFVLPCVNSHTASCTKYFM